MHNSSKESYSWFQDPCRHTCGYRCYPQRRGILFSLSFFHRKNSLFFVPSCSQWVTLKKRFSLCYKACIFSTSISYCVPLSSIVSRKKLAFFTSILNLVLSLYMLPNSIQDVFSLEQLHSTYSSSVSSLSLLCLQLHLGSLSY